MTNPTSNFNWQMPTSTDLVTDLPADFEVFGQAVDTSMADLLGGTTGQVLSKASNTNMDFTWVAQDDSNAIQNSIVDAKGDLIGATANDTPARLAVGTNGQILTADSTTATGLKWATAGDTNDFVLINTTSFSAVSSQSVNDVFSSTYDNYVIKVNNVTATGDPFLSLRLRVSATDTTTGYRFQNLQIDNTTLAGSRNVSATSFTNFAYVNAAYNNDSTLSITNPFNTKVTTGFSNVVTGGGANVELNIVGFGLNNTTSYTGFTIIASTGNITGSVSVYGYKK